MAVRFGRCVIWLPGQESNLQVYTPVPYLRTGELYHVPDLVVLGELRRRASHALIERPIVQGLNGARIQRDDFLERIDLLARYRDG